MGIKHGNENYWPLALFHNGVLQNGTIGYNSVNSQDFVNNDVFRENFQIRRKFQCAVRDDTFLICSRSETG